MNLNDDVALIYTRLSISAPFYGYLKLLKATRKGNKSLRSYPGIELWTSRTEGRALTNCADLLLFSAYESAALTMEWKSDCQSCEFSLALKRWRIVKPAYISASDLDSSCITPQVKINLKQLLVNFRRPSSQAILFGYSRNEDMVPGLKTVWKKSFIAPPLCISQIIWVVTSFAFWI